jgi:drug/metabolite transporter (DMT)-like permease
MRRSLDRSSTQKNVPLGLMAIELAATLWAVAAIVASRLFQAGVRPFQLAAVRAVIAAIGLSVIDRLALWRVHKLVHWRILALGIPLALVTAIYYVAIALLSEAIVQTCGAVGVMARGFVVSSFIWIAVQMTQGIPIALSQF